MWKLPRSKHFKTLSDGQRTIRSFRLNVLYVKQKPGSGGSTAPALYEDKVQARERSEGKEKRKSHVRWPHSDNKPGKSLSLEMFRNHTVVYTGGSWVERDVRRERTFCNTSLWTPNTQHVMMTHRRSSLESDLSSHLSFRLHLSRSVLNFQSAEVSDAPLSPGLSTSERLPPGTEASGWLVCLACSNNIHLARVQHTWMATIAQKVAGQTIVDTTAHHCQVKGSRARRWRYTWAGLDSHDLSALNPRILQSSQEMDHPPTEASVGGVTKYVVGGVTHLWAVSQSMCFHYVSTLSHRTHTTIKHLAQMKMATSLVGPAPSVM